MTNERMRELLFASFFFPFLALVVSCADMSISPDTVFRDDEIPIPVNDDTLIVQNIPWILTSATMGDSALDLSLYKNFHFLLGDTLVYGDDGCNSYYGAAAVTEDSLIVSWIAYTTAGCSPLWFVSCDLINRWALSVNDSMLVLQANNARLEFSSRYTRAVHNYPIYDREWILLSSNDPAFEALRDADLLPILELTRDRGFTLRWYCSPENPVDCNGMRGKFAVGEDQSLYLYYQGSGGTWKFYDLGDFHMEWRMMEANRFEYSSDSFTLFREDGITYLFVPAQ